MCIFMTYCTGDRTFVMLIEIITEFQSNHKKWVKYTINNFIIKTYVTQQNISTCIPNTIGNHSEYVICWISATTSFLASWKILSSFQWGFKVYNLSAKRLCSRNQTVCITANCGELFTRTSPAIQYVCESLMNLHSDMHTHTQTKTSHFSQTALRWWK